MGFKEEEEERARQKAASGNVPTNLPRRTWNEAAREFGARHVVLSGAGITVVGIGAYEGIKAGVKYAAGKIRRKTTEKVSEGAARALVGGALSFLE